MKLVDTAIDLRISVVALTVLCALAGGQAYVSLPKEANPSIEIPNIVVTTLYPGASPSDVERLITEPIEREVQGINGIDVMRSTSTEGVSTVIIEFTPDVSIDYAHDEVQKKVDLARPDLPADAEEPMVDEIDLSEFPILTINLAADYGLERLKNVAENLQDALEAIPSVLEVDLIGGREEEVQVDVDLSQLQAYGLAFQDLVDTISRENTNLPGGSIDVDHLNYLVRVNGQFDQPEEISDLVIKAPDDRPIYIRDVATVRRGFKERTSYSRLRVIQHDAPGITPQKVDDVGYLTVVSLNVKKRSGENILDTNDAIQAVLADFDMPEGTRVLLTGDQSEQVLLLVKDLENNIISGLLFVVAVLLFFLGLRTSILVGIAIPLSMAVAFLVFAVMGETLNFIILFSLIIALGMLVDNAVVIVENIYRFLEEGHDHFEAARLATAEVGMAVVASTATTVAAFAPMLFWPGIIGEFMGFMPKTLIITLSCSLFVALIINPVVTGYFARVEGADEVRGSVAPWARFVMVALGAMLLTALALVNPISAGVLAGFVAAMWLGYVLVLGPIGRGFVQTALPRVIEAYRGFLAWMLVRDYTARRAYLRNMFALVAFTVGVTFAMVGGLIGGTPGKVFLFPGGALAALGLVGILIHTLEGIFLGARGSVLAGVGLGAVMAALLGLMSLGGAYEEALAIQFMIAPVLLFVFGLLGWVLRPKSGRLILTDNRARLMNATLGGLFLIAGIYGAAPTGVEFFPETDPNQIQVVVEASLGTNLDASDRVAREVTRRVDALVGSDPNAQRAVENVLVNVGIGGDAMFGGGAAASPERSRLVMNLVDFEDRFEASRETMAKLREQLVGVPGAEIEFQRDEQGPPTGPPVNIEISGPDFGTIVGISRRLKAQLTEAHDTGRIPELVDIRDNLKEGRPEVAVRIDRERAARFGLDTQKIASTVRTAINGSKASTWRDGKDEFDITVRLAEGDRADLESLRRLDILHEGRTIPLVSVAEFVPGAGLGSITRKDQFRVVTVQANVTSGANAQAVLGAVQADLAESGFEETLPEGYNLKYTGENEDQQKSFAFLTTALGLGVALIFMIMIAQFNSVLLPFIIIVAVALSMTGVMLGLIVTRLPYSLFTFIGVISLAGIVVNNNIVLIDYIQQLRERGLSKRDAIIEGGATRLRPVALTALTTVLGLIPLTFGINIDFVGLFVSLAPDFRIGSANTQFWGPMGVAIISGLTFATFLTLVVVPVMYSLFDSTAERVAVAFGRAPKAPAGPAEEDALPARGSEPEPS